MDFLLPLKWFTVRRLPRVFAPQLRSGENLLVAAAAEAYLGGEGQRRNGVVAVTDERVLVLQVNRLIPLAAGEVIFVSPRQETLVMPSRGGARRKHRIRKSRRTRDSPRFSSSLVASVDPDPRGTRPALTKIHVSSESELLHVTLTNTGMCGGALISANRLEWPWGRAQGSLIRAISEVNSHERLESHQNIFERAEVTSHVCIKVLRFSLAHSYSDARA